MLNELRDEAARYLRGADVEGRRFREVEMETHQQEVIHVIIMMQGSLASCKFT